MLHIAMTWIELIMKNVRKFSCLSCDLELPVARPAALVCHVVTAAIVCVYLYLHSKKRVFT